MDDNGVGPAESESGLVNVTHLPLAELLASKDSVLDNAVRRVLADMECTQDIIAGFASAVPSDRTTPNRPAIDDPTALE